MSKSNIRKKKETDLTIPSRKNSLWIIIILGFSFLEYGNTLYNGYALDDGIMIRENKFVQQGVGGIRNILAHDLFFGWYQNANTDIAGGRYRPVSLISFAVEHQVAGDNPGFSHFINVLLLALTGVLIFLLLKKLLIQFPGKYSALTHLPFITSLLFISHPIHTEAVANIKGRDEILAMLFCVLASIQVLNWIDNGRKIKNIVVAFLFFLLAILSKENALTFIIVIPLMLWFFRNEKLETFLPLALALLLPVGIFLLLRFEFAFASFHPASDNLMNNPFAGLNMEQKYATIIFTFGKYLLLLLFPHPLTSDYYPYQISIHDFAGAGTLISLIVCVALIVISIFQLRKKTLLSFCIFYSIITFLP